MDIKKYVYAVQEELLNEVLTEEREQTVITTEDYQNFSKDFAELLQMKKDIAILRTEQHLAKIEGIAKFWHVFGIVALIVSVVLVLFGVLELASLLNQI